METKHQGHKSHRGISAKSTRRFRRNERRVVAPRRSAVEREDRIEPGTGATRGKDYPGRYRLKRDPRFKHKIGLLREECVGYNTNFWFEGGDFR